jgi:sugar-specific transcriptional regulator TrmB
MEEETIVKLGLSKNEAKIYLSLLKLGNANASNLSKDSGVHRVNVYESLEKLRKKNLITESKKNNKKTFEPVAPKNLMNILKQKEIELMNILPQLELKYKMAENRTDVSVHEGYDFVRNMFINFVEKREDIYNYGIPKFVVKEMGKWFQNEIHKRRAKQKQWMYHIYNSDAKERIKTLNTFPYTKARYLSSEYDQTVTTVICGDEVAMEIYEEENSKPTIILIKNQSVADAYKKYFWLIWEKAKTK